MTDKQLLAEIKKICFEAECDYEKYAFESPSEVFQKIRCMIERQTLERFNRVRRANDREEAK